MYTLPHRLALVSHSVPPALSGTAVRTLRMFREIAPESYCIFTCRDIPKLHKEDPKRRLPGEYVRLPSEWRRIDEPKSRLLRPLAQYCNTWLQVAQRTRNLIRLIRDRKCGAVMAVTGDLADLPSAYFASRRLGLPFFSMVDDDYLYQWPYPWQRRFARRVEPWIMKGSSLIFAISEFGADAYRSRYGVTPEVLYGFTDSAVLDTPGDVPIHKRPAPVRILFTGTVWNHNFDAIDNMVKALRLITKFPVELHIFTSQDINVLKRQGLDGPVIFHAPVSPHEIQSIQKDSDILYLPLSIDAYIPQLLKTAFPSKIADYLVSGRPILAYASPDSFLIYYVRSRNCAAIVEVADPETVASAIRRICTDQRFRQTIVKNSFTAAARDFDYDKVLKNVVSCISEAMA